MQWTGLDLNLIKTVFFMNQNAYNTSMSNFKNKKYVTLPSTKIVSLTFANKQINNWSSVIIRGVVDINIDTKEA